MYSPQYVYIRFCSRNLTCRLYKTEKKKNNNEFKRGNFHF